MANRECALEILTVASLLEVRGANPYRVRAYRRAALRLLRMQEDATTYLSEQGELVLPGLGARLRRKLGELVGTGTLSFHDELLKAEPRAVQNLMAVPGIGPKTADRLISEAKVRGLKSLVRASRRGRLHRMAGVGETREHAWSAAAESMLATTAAARDARRRARTAPLGAQLPLPLTTQEPALAKPDGTSRGASPRGSATTCTAEASPATTALQPTDMASPEREVASPTATPTRAA